MELLLEPGTFDFSRLEGRDTRLMHSVGEELPERPEQDSTSPGPPGSAPPGTHLLVGRASSRPGTPAS